MDQHGTADSLQGLADGSQIVFSRTPFHGRRQMDVLHSEALDGGPFVLDKARLVWMTKIQNGANVEFRELALSGEDAVKERQSAQRLERKVLPFALR